MPCVGGLQQLATTARRSATSSATDTMRTSAAGCRAPWPRARDVERELRGVGDPPPAARGRLPAAGLAGLAGLVGLEPEALEKGSCRGRVALDAGDPGQEGGKRSVGGEGRHQSGLHGRQVVETVQGDRHAGARGGLALSRGAGGKGVEAGVVDQAAALQGGDVVAVQRRQVGSLA